MTNHFIYLNSAPMIKNMFEEWGEVKGLNFHTYILSWWA
jgi:hypothetical protein